MKKILLVIALTMATMNMYAQSIQVVDNDGSGIPLVSVLTEERCVNNHTGQIE